MNRNAKRSRLRFSGKLQKAQIDEVEIQVKSLIFKKIKG